MFQKVIQHVSKSVAKKKEEYERRSSLIFADIYKKHVFRRALARRIRVRQAIVNFLYKFRFVMQMRKIYISYMMTREIVDRAFAIGKQQANERSIKTVQRIFRGFSVRDKKLPLVVHALKTKENLKLHVAAKIIQKRLRGFTVRSRLMHMQRVAMKIQGFIKMKWYRELFVKLRINAKTIQRCVRRFLTRRAIIKSRMYAYLEREVTQLYKVID